MAASRDKTALKIIADVSNYLKSAGIESFERESELMASRISGMDRVAIYRDGPELDDGVIDAIFIAAKRRSLREPLQYILGEAEFFGMIFKVGHGVLVPRPETEIIIEELLRRVKPPGAGVEILDLCTGSGCLAVAAKKSLKDAVVMATDISETALEYSRLNAAAHVSGDIKFYQGKLFEPVRGKQFDVIMSNPPYIKSSDIETLMPDVRDFEPRMALDGGADGLDYYRLIISDAPEYLRPGGSMILELGIGQADDVSTMAKASGFENIKIIEDINGIKRVIAAVCRRD